jgi:CelD/BcsL family acetyltransferase involved in cellulose biosynthesis
VITVTIDNKEVAYNIFYSHEDTLIFTGNTFDEKYKQYSLGFITTANSIKWAFENGYKKVILGPGDFGYKARLSNRQEVLYEYKL